LAAAVNNIPLLVKNVGLSTLLAVARVYDVIRTGTGLPGLANAVVRTFTDPATGIPFVGQSRTAGAITAPTTPAPTSALTAPADQRAATPLATTDISTATPAEQESAPPSTAHVTNETKAGKPANLGKSPRQAATGTAAETGTPTATTRHRTQAQSSCDVRAQ
jgi:hypothetical protein